MKLRVIRPVCLAALLLALLALLAPQVVGGANVYVTTHGNSMEPRFHTGDLAVIRSADHYTVGDVAAYRSDLLKVVAMHRIVAVEGGRFTFKGDNNSWLDPEHPTAASIIGKLVVRVPQGGVWLGRATSPVVLALVVLALMAGGGTAVQRRGRRRRGTMSRHAPSVGVTVSVATMTPTLRGAATATTVMGLVAVVLGALSWTGSGQQASTTQLATPREMTFAYSARVPRSAAYDGTTASSPDPIFRKLADTVEVRFSYRGSPGNIAVVARLSTASGWHSTVPLTPATPFIGNRYDGTVGLDLAALEARAQAAAVVTGLPAGDIKVILAPTVTTRTEKAFEPTLALALTPLQLSLAAAPDTLAVKDSTTTLSTESVPRTLSFKGRDLAVSTARTVSLALIVLSLLTAVAIALIARRTSPTDEAQEIRRRWPSLLVRVHPTLASDGRPVVDVTEFVTLVKLAERYGLLIEHWARGDTETFVVQDGGTTYRYRTGTLAQQCADFLVGAYVVEGS